MGMDSEVKKMSDITPVFNTEKYLRQCVESLQSHHSHFDGLIHEDELWMSVICGLAQSDLFTNVDFYCYRQQKENEIIRNCDPVRQLHA